MNEFSSFYSNIYYKKTVADANYAPREELLNVFKLRNSKRIKKITKMFKNSPIGEEEVKQAINKFKKNSAPGSDGLTSDLYKSHSNFFAPLLAELFNSICYNKAAPRSFLISIIKLIPKIENSLNVDEFRPISLLNTDLKILSHVLASHIRDSLNNLIRKHQLAYLPKRSIHTAIIRARLAQEKLGKSNCVVAIDFSKAFDRTDRDYILNVLTAIGCPEIITSLISIIYTDTKAMIEIGGYLSRPIRVDNGIKQGCPLSALLIILGMEPLLQAIRYNNSIKSNQALKIVAYADDISVFIKRACIGNLLDEINKFNLISKLALNVDKTKVLSLGFVPKQLKKISSLKLLGIRLSLNDSLKIKTKILEDTINNSAKFSLKCMTLRARSLNIETFVTSRLVYVMRHLELTKTFIDRLEMKLINSVWLGGKHSINKQILYLPFNNGGTGFKNLNFYIAAAKIFDMVSLLNTLGSNKEVIYFKKSKIFRSFKNFLIKKNIFILEFARDSFQLVQNGKVINPMKMNMSSLYAELMLPNYKTKVIARKSANFYPDLNLSDKSLIFQFLTKIWKHKKFTPLDKNILYLFFLNSYLDKPRKWIKNLVDHPLCYSCEREFETMQHLFFACENCSTFKEKLNFNSIKDLLVEENVIGMKYIVAKLISSWCQDTSEYLKKLGSIP